MGSAWACCATAWASTSVLAAHTWSTDESARISAAITVGGITGYELAPVVPMVVPSVALRLTPTLAVRALLLPRWHPKQGATAVHLAIEVTL